MFFIIISLNWFSESKGLRVILPIAQLRCCKVKKRKETKNRVSK